jgi:chromosome segregation ATPase
MSRPFIVTGLAIIAVGIVVLLVAVVQSQRHLKAVKKELASTNEQVVKLEKVIGDLKMEVDEATKIRTQSQDNLNEANSTIEQLRKDIDAAQSQAKENQTHAEELTTELEKARKEADEQLTAEREATQK